MGILESKNFGINRVNYQKKNKRCNCENEVSCQKLAVPRNNIF